MLGLVRLARLGLVYLRPWLPVRSERGQTLLEYLVIAGVVSVVVLIGIAIYADEVQDWFVSVGTWLEGGAAPLGPSYTSGTVPPAPD